MGNTCCATDNTDRVAGENPATAKEPSDKMRAAAPAFSSEKVDHPTGTPAHNVTPTEQAKAPEAVKEEPKAASFAPVKEEPKLEPKVEEVKIDEHAGAVDYEKSATVNIMAPAVKIGRAHV